VFAAAAEIPSVKSGKVADLKSPQLTQRISSEAASSRHSNETSGNVNEAAQSYATGYATADEIELG
jgi:hypothetical protein